MKKKLFICIKEHMDPLWRRCFDRDILYKGQLFVPYSDLEAFYIEDNLKFCKKYPFYRFELESVLVLKKFLEKHPEYEQDIAHLSRTAKCTYPLPATTSSTAIWYRARALSATC